MNLGDLNKVWEIKALKKLGQDEAKKILEKIAKQVQPIMRKRNWRVKLLSEFCPKNPSLLGLNVGGGVHVKLRLRRANRDWDFIPYDQVLDTMLHELCHNVHGPHNASFYSLWDELRKECEDLIAKGISGSGDGFDLPGRRLGGFTRQPPISALRQTALAAAEKRVRLGSLMPSGPKRVGGDSTIMAALTPVQAAAMAAERRLYDDTWCGSHSSDVLEDEDCSGDFEEIAGERQSTGSIIPTSNVGDRKRRQLSEGSPDFQSVSGPSESNFIDLTTPDQETKSQRRRYTSDTSTLAPFSKDCPQATFVSSSAASTSSFSYKNDTSCGPCEPDMWECATCTLLNPPLAPICSICSSEKPEDVNMKYQVWTCKFCTLENSVRLEKCSACEQWRYSYGAPVATPAPTYST